MGCRNKLTCGALNAPNWNPSPELDAVGLGIFYGTRTCTSLSVSSLLAFGIEDRGMSALACHSEIILCVPFCVIVPTP